MGDVDYKSINRTSSQKILEKLQLMKTKIVALISEAKVVNKPMGKDSDIYKNKRNVYVNQMNNKDIKFQKSEH